MQALKTQGSTISLEAIEGQLAIEAAAQVLADASAYSADSVSLEPVVIDEA
ncbi:MAG: hypothetical protein MRQ13_05550 [Candidatus Midichloria sp.]|nr:hypothetical protein [Candidatus Midichloria sp.]